jgi:hypothetical protein
VIVVVKRSAIASAAGLMRHRRLRPFGTNRPRLARARLTARPRPTGTWPATAECTLVLEDGLIVSAGAIGTSVRDAVDELTTRLRRRLAAPAPSVRNAHGALRPADRRRSVRRSHLGLRTDRRVSYD